MARKSYRDIIQELAPQSTGTRPVVVSMPLLYYHFGRYHVVALVTGGQSEGAFVRPNRRAGHLLGVVFYHPDSKTGEYLTLARAKEKYGLNLQALSSPAKASLQPKDLDDKINLPKKLRIDAAERFMKNRLALEDYNAQLMLAAAQQAEYGRRLLAFRLDPDLAPRYPNPQRRKILWLRCSVFALLAGYLLLSYSLASYQRQVIDLRRENQKLNETSASQRADLAEQRVRNYVINGEYDAARSIAADSHNGEIADHIRGRQDARVTIVEYVDFQCPGCAAMSSVMEQLYQEYSDRVSFVQRNYPLSIHANARFAARAAEAAALQDLYWPYSQALFANQTVWSDLNIARLKDYLLQLFAELAPNADQEKFAADLESDAVYQKVAFDLVLGSGQHQISYTPTIYLNGKKLDITDEQAGEPYAIIDAAIRTALGK